MSSTCKVRQKVVDYTGMALCFSSRCWIQTANTFVSVWHCRCVNVLNINKKIERKKRRNELANIEFILPKCVVAIKCLGTKLSFERTMFHFRRQLNSHISKKNVGISVIFDFKRNKNQMEHVETKSNEILKHDTRECTVNWI